MKTSGVKILVREVLATLEAPFTEHVIDDVFRTIEVNHRFRSRYDLLCDQLGKTVVNNWCGQWVAHALGKTEEVQVPSRSSTLIGSYSILDADVTTVARNLDEDAALQLMSNYYRANKERLPTDIRVHRDAIVELIVAGVTAQNAFAAVIRSDTSA